MHYKIICECDLQKDINLNSCRNKGGKGMYCHWKKYTHITTKERRNNLIIKCECTSGICATITPSISSFT